MLSKTIKFENLDGDEVEKTFYFNLNKTEVAEMALAIGAEDNDLEKYFFDIIRRKDAPKLIAVFKDIIARSIGERTEDNVSFRKNDAIREGFLGSDAYSELFLFLFEDPDGNNLMNFMRGVLPKSIAEQLKDVTPEDLEKVASGEMDPKELSAGPNVIVDNSETPKVTDAPSTPNPGVPEDTRRPEQYSREELLALSDTEFVKLVGSDPQKMDHKVLTIAFERKNRSQVAAGTTQS